MKEAKVPLSPSLLTPRPLASIRNDLRTLNQRHYNVCVCECECQCQCVGPERKAARKRFDKARALVEKGEPQGEQSVEALKQEFENISAETQTQFTECNMAFSINTISAVCNPTLTPRHRHVIITTPHGEVRAPS